VTQVPAILVTLGGLLFLMALLGGGITLKEISLPPISSRLRIVLVPISLGIMAFGIWLSLGGALPPPAAPASEQATQPSPQAFGQPPVVASPAQTTDLTPTSSAPEALYAYRSAGTLIYEEDFEDGIANGWLSPPEVHLLADGNHVLGMENDQPMLSLPHDVSDYVIEARILMHAGAGGSAGIGVRAMPGGAMYFSYVDFAGGWVNLVEAQAGEEVRGPDWPPNGYRMVVSQGVWYTLALEGRGSLLRDYLDGELLQSGEDDSNQSNRIILWSCCGDSGPHTFYFDDVRVWSVD